MILNCLVVMSGKLFIEAMRPEIPCIGLKFLLSARPLGINFGSKLFLIHRGKCPLRMVNFELTYHKNKHTAVGCDKCKKGRNSRLQSTSERDKIFFWGVKEDLSEEIILNLRPSGGQQTLQGSGWSSAVEEEGSARWGQGIFILKEVELLDGPL